VGGLEVTARWQRQNPLSVRDGIVGTVVTSHAHEAVAEQATGEELLGLPLDEARIAEPMLRMLAGALEQ